MTHTIQVGLVVCVANAALLVLQLIAGRLLAPYIGVSLETWTAVIAAFLSGISLGNWVGGRLADHSASNRVLGVLLLVGAASTTAMLAPLGVFRAVPLGPRIAAAAFALCLPVSLALSLITPVAIRALLPDVSRTGRVVGLVYALGTFGSLAGNFLTGFVLLAYFTTTTIVLGCAAALAGLGMAFLFIQDVHGAATNKHSFAQTPVADAPGSPKLGLPAAWAIVFIASFCSMALEIGASRLLAPTVGVSLYSWTGIIGIVLIGIVAGNYSGGRLADKNPTTATLGSCLFYSGLFALIVLLLQIVIQRWGGFDSLNLMLQVVAWATALFLLPMFLLATISPVVTRLAVGDLAHAGRVAGSVYAWSCLGAIAGTLATGWWLIALLQVKVLILVVSLVLTALSAIVGRPWHRPAELFGGSIVLGSALFGMHLQKSLDLPEGYYKETNYYRIWAYPVDYHGSPAIALALDRLVHSYADPDNPLFLGYPHEQVQAEFARLSAERAGGAPRVLVIGGGGYTFPRWVEFALPQSTIEVVEIDPGVTEAAHAAMGLKRDTRIVSHHMDGRQFVEERAAKGSFQLIVQDAVNDLSVPYHIMTKEYNDAIQSLLDPQGVYLLTVIDDFEVGQLMRSAARTLKQTFKHVELLGENQLWLPAPGYKTVGRQVWVIYASDAPFDGNSLRAATRNQNASPARSVAMPKDEFDAYLSAGPPIILTDTFAPVDNLISVVFRLRSVERE